MKPSKHLVTLMGLITAIVVILGAVLFLAPNENSIAVDPSTLSPDYAEGIHAVYLYVDEQDLITLYTSDVMDNTGVTAQIALGDKDTPLQTVHLRFRGNSTRYDIKKPFRVTFDTEQAYFNGRSRINLNAMYSDASMMKEQLAMGMFQDVHLPASDMQYVNVYINDIYEGLYVDVARVDRIFLANNGLNDRGTLIRDETRHHDLGEAHKVRSVFGLPLEVVDEIPAVFDTVNNPDFEAVEAFVSWVVDTKVGDAFHEGLMDFVDLEAFITWIAIHEIIMDMDAYADDYWMYLDHEETDAKWQMIPWDKDITFGITWLPDLNLLHHEMVYLNPVYSDWAFENQLIMKFKATKSLRELLYARIEELLDTVFTMAYFEDRIQNLSTEALRYLDDAKGQPSFKLHGSQSFDPEVDFDLYVERMLDYIELRRAFLYQDVLKMPGEPFKATLSYDEVAQMDGLFVDGNGMVMAKWMPQVPMTEGVVTMTLSEDVVDGYRRKQWHVTYDGPQVEGVMVLFYGDYRYRSNVSFFDVDATRLDYPINPYSKKITIPITLSESWDFELVSNQNNVLEP